MTRQSRKPVTGTALSLAMDCMGYRRLLHTAEHNEDDYTVFGSPSAVSFGDKASVNDNSDTESEGEGGEIVAMADDDFRHRKHLRCNGGVREHADSVAERYSTDMGSLDYPIHKQKHRIVRKDQAHDVVKETTALFEAIRRGKWDLAKSLLKSGCVSYNTTVEEVLCSDKPRTVLPLELVQTWTTIRLTNGELIWKRLVIHEALAKEAPTDLLYKVFELYPSAVRFADSDGNMPLHLALKYNADSDVVQMILQEHLGALESKNGKGRLPLECVSADSSPMRGQVLQRYVHSAKHVASGNVNNLKHDVAVVTKSIEAAKSELRLAKVELVMMKEQYRHHAERKTKEESGMKNEVLRLRAELEILRTEREQLVAEKQRWADQSLRREDDSDETASCPSARKNGAPSWFEEEFNQVADELAHTSLFSQNRSRKSIRDEVFSRDLHCSEETKDKPDMKIHESATNTSEDEENEEEGEEETGTMSVAESDLSAKSHAEKDQNRLLKVQDIASGIAAHEYQRSLLSLINSNDDNDSELFGKLCEETSPLDSLAIEEIKHSSSAGFTPEESTKTEEEALAGKIPAAPQISEENTVTKTPQNATKQASRQSVGDLLSKTTRLVEDLESTRLGERIRSRRKKASEKRSEESCISSGLIVDIPIISREAETFDCLQRERRSPRSTSSAEELYARPKSTRASELIELASGPRERKNRPRKKTAEKEEEIYGESRKRTGDLKRPPLRKARDLLVEAAKEPLCSTGIEREIQMASTRRKNDIFDELGKGTRDTTVGDLTLMVCDLTPKIRNTSWRTNITGNIPATATIPILGETTQPRKANLTTKPPENIPVASPKQKTGERTNTNENVSSPAKMSRLKEITRHQTKALSSENLRDIPSIPRQQNKVTKANANEELPTINRLSKPTETTHQKSSALSIKLPEDIAVDPMDHNTIRKSETKEEVPTPARFSNLEDSKQHQKALLSIELPKEKLSHPLQKVRSQQKNKSLFAKIADDFRDEVLFSTKTQENEKKQAKKHDSGLSEKKKEQIMDDDKRETKRNESMKSFEFGASWEEKVSSTKTDDRESQKQLLTVLWKSNAMATDYDTDTSDGNKDTERCYGGKNGDRKDDRSSLINVETTKGWKMRINGQNSTRQAPEQRMDLDSELRYECTDKRELEYSLDMFEETAEVALSETAKRAYHHSTTVGSPRQNYCSDGSRIKIKRDLWAVTSSEQIEILAAAQQESFESSIPSARSIATPAELHDSRWILRKDSTYGYSSIA